jgi:hypothetical protein
VPTFTFRNARDGSTFDVEASDTTAAIVKAQAQHDQADADKRRAMRLEKTRGSSGELA